MSDVENNNHFSTPVKLGEGRAKIRCLRAYLNLLYKIIFGMCDIDSNSLLSLHNDVLTRGHRYKVMQEHCVLTNVKMFRATYGTRLE